MLAENQNQPVQTAAPSPTAVPTATIAIPAAPPVLPAAAEPAKPPVDEALSAPIAPTAEQPKADAALTDTNKQRICLKALKNIERDLATVIRLLEGHAEAGAAALVEIAAAAPSAAKEEELTQLRPSEGRVIEGVFDGQNMVGSDGKIYTVPANYASKSKLVEGDLLKLTITPKGSFIYKQIGPIERARVIGSLGFDQTIGEFYAATENKRWSVIKASVTYFKGEPGDEVVLLVPKNAPSKWAAVENIIKRNPLA